MNLFQKTGINDMAFALSVLTEKNTQVSRNIANADTPMYRAKKLEFKEVMAAYTGQSSLPTLYKTHEKHIDPQGSPLDVKNFVRRQNNPSTRTDGNDVNMDYEMSEQAGASIMYSVLAEMTGNKFASIKNILRTR